ncbi:MAG: hypothetical protein KDA89_10895 [Planctomycetaceae bacterium]|nr:hypothetical protein [Planctomycetaceae bacterium]
MPNSDDGDATEESMVDEQSSPNCCDDCEAPLPAHLQEIRDKVLRGMYLSRAAAEQSARAIEEDLRP